MDVQKQNGALLIAACIVAAIRLRGEPIRPSPKLMSTIADAVQLARMVLREIERLRTVKIPEISNSRWHFYLGDNHGQAKNSGR